MRDSNFYAGGLGAKTNEQGSRVVLKDEREAHVGAGGGGG